MQFDLTKRDEYESFRVFITTLKDNNPRALELLCGGLDQKKREFYQDLLASQRFQTKDAVVTRKIVAVKKRA